MLLATAERCYFGNSSHMTRVVRKSPSSGLKNRVILAYRKLSQLVEMLQVYECMHVWCQKKQKFIG